MLSLLILYCDVKVPGICLYKFLPYFETKEALMLSDSFIILLWKKCDIYQGKCNHGYKILAQSIRLQVMT